MKIALVGCGSIATAHVRSLSTVVPSARLYLCDVDRSRCEELAAKWDVQGVYTDFDDLLLSAQPDSAHILTPLPSHAELARKAIEGGCHVLIEKPVTEASEEFKQISDLAVQRKKILCVDYSTLGIPIVLKASNEVASGRLGRLISVHCNYCASWPGNTIPYGDPNHWSYSLKAGILQNWVDHPASLVLNVMDPILDEKIVFTSRNILPNDCPDLLHVAVRNEDQIGSFTLSLGHGSSEIRAYFLLEGGTIVLDIRRMLVSFTRGKGPQNFIRRALSGMAEGYSLFSGTLRNSFQIMTGKLQREPGILNVIDNFYKAINSQEELLVNHKTVLAVTQLIDKIWKGIR